MYITAAIIGLGIYILFKDLPQPGQEIAYKYKWAAHGCVFFGLFAMHGGSAEGTVLAAIGTVVFRWLMHMSEKKAAKIQQRIVAKQAALALAQTETENTGDEYTEFFYCMAWLGAWVILINLFG